MFDEFQGQTVGRDASGVSTDEAIPARRSKLNVGTQKVATGKAWLRKYIVGAAANAYVVLIEVAAEPEPVVRDTKQDIATSLSPALRLLRRSAWWISPVKPWLTQHIQLGQGDSLTLPRKTFFLDVKGSAHDYRSYATDGCAFSGFPATCP